MIYSDDKANNNGFKPSKIIQINFQIMQQYYRNLLKKKLLKKVKEIFIFFFLRIIYSVI